MGGDHKGPSTFKITKKEDELILNIVFKVFEFLSEVCAIYVPQSGNYFRPITNMKTGPKNHLICLSPKVTFFFPWKRWLVIHSFKIQNLVFFFSPRGKKTKQFLRK